MSDQDFVEYETWDDDDTSDYLPCPECGAEVYVDAVQCPECGWYITWDSSNGRSPRWDRLVKTGFLIICFGTLAYVVMWLLPG